MSVNAIVTLMSSICSLIGTFGGILVGSKLTNYRIEQLEKKVEKHNSVVERTYKIEGQIVELQHDVGELKEKHK